MAIENGIKLVAWFCCLLATVAASGVESEQAAHEFFERQVRPILVQRCYGCHSADADELEGGFRLDSRSGMLAGGDSGPAVIPGDVDQSRLIDAINYGEVFQMPPKSKMPQTEIDTLTRWVATGAWWPDEVEHEPKARVEFDLLARKNTHWCWEPLHSPALPPVHDRDWPQQDLDRYILSRLEQAGLHPADRAEKQTLIRRLHFDLWGLPPSPEEVVQFIEDGTPDAYERLVDRTLDAPRLGERWARHWMDLVRYAETYGHEFDYDLPHAYKYRDYLIRAFNADVPYDQFIYEQVAGDLLSEPRLNPELGFNESILGTGFWWLGEATHSPVDVRADEANRVDNQIDVLTKSFLGLTVACARCHDHKFDAISTADYYALSGILRSSRRHEALLDEHGVNRTTAADIQRLLETGRQAVARQLTDWAATTESEFAERLVKTWDHDGSNDAASDASGGAAPADKQRGSAEATDKRWLDAVRDPRLVEVDHPLHAWRRLLGQPVNVTSLGQLRNELESRAAAVENASEPLATFAESFTGWFPAGPAFGARPTHAGDWNGGINPVQLQMPGLASSARLGRSFEGVLRSPTFTIEQPSIAYRVRGKGKVRVIVDGYFMDAYNGLLFAGFKFDVDSPDRFIWHVQSQDLGRYLGHRAYIEIYDEGDQSIEVDEIRYCDGDAPGVEWSKLSRRVLAEGAPTTAVDIAVSFARQWCLALEAVADRKADAEQTELVNWGLRHELFDGNRLVKSLAPHVAEIQSIESRIVRSQRVLAITDGTGEDQPVYIRGNHRTPGEVARRQFLTAIVGQRPILADGSGRLELAREIADPENPLTLRVVVNRIWHHLLGRGIVASVDNFGVLGEEPTHPDLLDHLATRFVEEGWSIKRMIRTIVLSSTYQMSSHRQPESSTIDPVNRLIHHVPIRRLQGEAIRDAVLSLSGELDTTMFGPSVPVHVSQYMQGRGRPKENGPVDGSGRRSIYLEVRRNFLSPMMLAFDTPIPFNTVGSRNVSNVPAQALILMNDPFIVDQAAKWATRVRDLRLTTEETITHMYLAAFARRPTADEQAAAIDFMRLQSVERGDAPDEGQYSMSDWADLAHVLLNVKEFVFVQ